MKTTSTTNSPAPINWQTILKIIIAVLSAILGVISEAKFNIAASLFNL